MPVRAGFFIEINIMLGTINNNEFKKITLGKIEHIHSMITKNLGIPRNIRKSPVGVTGTKYKPLDVNNYFRFA